MRENSVKYVVLTTKKVVSSFICDELKELCEEYYEIEEKYEQE